MLWQQTTDDNLEEDARKGMHNPVKVSEKLIHDIQMLVSRLVEKAHQLIGNFTTNMAESWMHIRSKFDGGKVINRYQSGSWQGCCMGAGLQQNLRKTWGPTVWSDMTASIPNRIFTDIANTIHKETESTRKRKSTDKSKENRRKSKYARTDNSAQARKAYSRHDNGTCPDEVVEDVLSQYLEEQKEGFYRTKVKVSKEGLSLLK